MTIIGKDLKELRQSLKLTQKKINDKYFGGSQVVGRLEKEGNLPLNYRTEYYLDILRYHKWKSTNETELDHLALTIKENLQQAKGNLEYVRELKGVLEQLVQELGNQMEKVDDLASLMPTTNQIIHQLPEEISNTYVFNGMGSTATNIFYLKKGIYKVESDIKTTKQSFYVNLFDLLKNTVHDGESSVNFRTDLFSGNSLVESRIIQVNKTGPFIFDVFATTDREWKLKVELISEDVSQNT